MKNNAKSKLLQQAIKIRKQINETGLKHGHLAKKTDIHFTTLSRFMSGKEDYVTESLVDKLEKFLKQYATVK